MRDIMTWQAFVGEDGKVDPDKGSVLTVYPKSGEGEAVVHNLTRKETFVYLGTFALTADFLRAKTEREAAQAFGGKVSEDARV